MNTINDIFNQTYYQTGETVSVQAPTIAGYTLPAQTSQQKVIEASDTTVNFVYAQAVANVAFSNSSVNDGSSQAPAIPTSVTSPLIRESSLSIPVTATITVTEAKLLAPDTAPVQAQTTIIGGVEFSLQSPVGATTTATYSLGGTVAHTALRVYKAAGNTLTDITNQVSFSTIDGKTTLSYSLTDGGDLDEDGVANGIIVDPIYIGIIPPVTGGSDGSSVSNARPPRSTTNGASETVDESSTVATESPDTVTEQTPPAPTNDTVVEKDIATTNQSTQSIWLWSGIGLITVLVAGIAVAVAVKNRK